MFRYNGNRDKLIAATEIANRLIKDDIFIHAIKNKKQFDMATCEPGYIADLIKKGDYLIAVKTYKPWWRFSKAYGYFTYKRPWDINLNVHKVERSTASLVGTLIHELVHALDYREKEHAFGHADNSPVGKENTAPYYIGSLARSMVSGKENFKCIVME